MEGWIKIPDENQKILYMKAKELWLKFLSCGSIKGAAFFY